MSQLEIAFERNQSDVQTSVRFFVKRTGICLVSVGKVGSERSIFVSDMDPRYESASKCSCRYPNLI